MWFQIAQLISWFIMPIAVIIVGWKINQRLKKIEYSQWANQRLIEKKLLLYDEIMPRMNDLFCFYSFVGNWKEISPSNVIDAKRLLDKKVNIYAAILGHRLVTAYEQFMKIAFETYTSEGADAKIRSIISGYDGDRRIHSIYTWDPNWERLFPTPASFDKLKFQDSYDEVVKAFQSSIGIIEIN